MAKNNGKLDLSSGDVGLGVKSRFNIAAMECVQPLSDHPKVSFLYPADQVPKVNLSMIRFHLS